MKKQNKRITNLPLVTLPVKAGFPVPTEDSEYKLINLHTYLVQNAQSTFFVKVEGMSMINSGIEPGDILVVDKSIQAVSGDIVIAVLDGSFTLKRFFKDSNQIKLIPENNSMSPILVDKDKNDFSIWGVVTGCVKKFR